MYKIKIICCFLFFIIVMNIYSQKKIDNDLDYLLTEKIESNNLKDSNNYPIVADSSRVLYVAYPEDFSTLMSSVFDYLNSYSEPINNGYIMLFIDNGIHIIKQFVSKINDGELYTKYNPMGNNDDGVSFTIEKKQFKKMVFPIKQELEKYSIITINVKEKGVYICKSFEPITK